MSFHDYTPILNLTTSKIRWTIRVKAQAVWKGVNRETKEFKGMNILFCDDSKYRIYAFINAKYCDRFEKDLKEGEIYKLTNFLVKEYTGEEMNRCVRNDKHIYFATFTKMEKDATYRLTIPEYSFDIFHLMDIPKFEKDTRFLCDVVGVITETENIQDYVNDKNEQKTQKNFSITDGRFSQKVTFFDEFAKCFDESLKNFVGDTIIVIISSAKVNKFQGDLYLTNYPATRFYLNVNHNIVKNLRIKASDSAFFPQKLIQVKMDVPDIFTVKDIKNLTHEYIGTNVICEVTVNEIKEEFHWYFHECTLCDNELEIIDGRYKCNTCKRFIPCAEKRFRIETICSDNTDEIAILFEDREIRRLTGKNVFELELEETLKQNAKDNSYPAILRDIELKPYTVTLKIKEENVKKGIKVYTAADILEGTKTIGPSSPSNATADEAHENLSQIEIDGANSLVNAESLDKSHNVSMAIELDNANTTPLTKMSTTKARARKSNEKDNYVCDEHISLNRLKAIKTEKISKKR